MSSAYQKRAAKLAQEIKALRRSDGSYSPEDLLSWAKHNPKSLLHASFEWDDSVAANEYRLEQARKILRRFIVVVKGKTQEVGLISVTSRRDDPTKGSYLTQPTIAASKVLRAEVLDQTVIQLRGLKERYGWLHELDDVWNAVP